MKSARPSRIVRFLLIGALAALPIAARANNWADVGQAYDDMMRSVREESDARRQRERDQSEKAARRQAELAAERARNAAQAREVNLRNYQSFLQRGGRGTKTMPPRFHDETAMLNWYLEHAQAGDAFAAFIVGRLHLRAQRNGPALEWLSKRDPDDPRAAATYAVALLRNATTAAEVERAKQILKKAAGEDTTGDAAEIYASVLMSRDRTSDGFRDGVLYLARAALFAERPTLIETIDLLARWDENMVAREARRRGYRSRLQQLALSDTDIYLAAAEHAKAQGESVVYGTLLGVVGELSSDDARVTRPFYLRWLQIMESRPTAWGGWDRREALDRLTNTPDRDARYLLPTSFNLKGGGSFIPSEDEQAAKLWQENAARIEEWSRSPGEFQARAARALIARDLGRWPKASPRQPPAVVLQRLRTLRIDAPSEILATEILEGVLTQNPQWKDQAGTLRWLDELIAQDATFRGLRDLYRNAPAQAENFWAASDPLLAAIIDATRATAPFTVAELDAAEAERDAAAALRLSDPPRAFGGLVKALKSGDALAGWQLLLMAEGRFRNILKRKQALIDLTDERLQRDAQGSGDRAATAALALHFLHHPEAPGREWTHFWRPTRASTQDWLQLAEQKGHPWAVYHSSAGYKAAEKALNRYDRDDQQVWHWLAQNRTALRKAELWKRDARLLQLFSPQTDIDRLQAPLLEIERAQPDLLLYADVVSRLPSARELVAARAKSAAPVDRESAAACVSLASALAAEDQAPERLLPHNLVRRLGLLVDASIHGDTEAPLVVAYLLSAPGTPPFAPHPDEAQKWLEIAHAHLIETAERGSHYAAMDAAYQLAQDYRSGPARDDAKALKYFTLAATLGHAQAASALRAAYAYGELGVAVNAAEQRKWERLADSIMMGRYRVPAAALEGRPPDPPADAGR